MGFPFSDQGVNAKCFSLLLYSISFRTVSRQLLVMHVWFRARGSLKVHMIFLFLLVYVMCMALCTGQNDFRLIPVTKTCITETAQQTTYSSLLTFLIFLLDHLIAYQSWHYDRCLLQSYMPKPYTVKPRFKTTP